MLSVLIEALYRYQSSIQHPELQKTLEIRTFHWRESKNVPPDEFLLSHAKEISYMQENLEKQYSSSLRPSGPAPLMGMDSKFDEFTYNSIVKRLPGIIETTLHNNPQFTIKQVESLQKMSHQLQHDLVVTLHDKFREGWEYHKELAMDKRWTQLPWFLVENLFYHEITIISEYEENHIDPFEKQKMTSLKITLVDDHTINSVAMFGDLKKVNEILKDAILLSLFGNFNDLSFSGGKSHNIIKSTEEKILINHLSLVVSKMEKIKNGKICIFLDNCGSELFYDLLLAHVLVENGISKQVIFYTKKFPVFVSDVMNKDLTMTIETLLKYEQYSHLAKKYTQHLEKGDWIVSEDEFLCGPLPFWEMPKKMKDLINSCDMVLFKGDANYRRSVGDLHWDMTIDSAQVWNYFDVPVVFLRSLKSGVQIGLPLDLYNKLNQEESEWCVNGTKSVIQFYQPNHTK